MGAVPVQDAKWLRSGKRAISLTSARMRAAPAEPIQKMTSDFAKQRHIEVAGAVNASG